MRYKITVGDNLETDRADTKECARTRATKLAFKYKGEVVVVRDVVNGNNAFTLRAPLNCPGCNDQ